MVRGVKTGIFALGILAFFFFLSAQSFYVPEERIVYVQESKILLKVFSGVGEAIVYCYSGDTKTTGFFISNDGWILTAGHKVDLDFPQANQIFVKLNRASREVYESVEIIPPTPGIDLLLFKIDYKPKAHLKEFSAPYLFEENWVFGFREDSGKVPSGAGYITRFIRIPNFTLTTARVFYGNSGSPAINREGKVIGVAVMMVKNCDGLLIPGPVVEKFIKDNLKKE